MKIYPIKVEKATLMDYKFIEWKIHNVCNYNCSFCGDRHKDGSQRWFSLEKYKEYVDKLADACRGKSFWIQLTGGEPTLYPKLIELLQYMKQKNAYVSLISNGSRTIRWWKDLVDAKCIDTLFLTYHSEQTENYQHIAEIANLFHNEPVKTICLITHVYTTLPKAFAAQEYFIENTGALITLKAMVMGSHEIYSQYTTEEFERIKNENYVGGKLGKTKTLPDIKTDHLINHSLRIVYNNLKSEIVDPQILLKTQTNRFLGYTCEIGKDNLRIDHDVIYRGVCEVGGFNNLNDENVGFFNDPVLCTSNECFCGTDMIAKKTRPFKILNSVE